MSLRRHAARANLALAAVLMFAVWVLIVWVASRPALKTMIDLTPQQVNSVDPATEELLRELREQKVEIEFHLFFPLVAGRAADQFQQQWMSIRDNLQRLTHLLVSRYQWLGGESVKVRTYDLTSDLAATREAAQAFGYTDADDAVVVAVRQPGRERRFRKLSLSADLAQIDLPELRGPSPGQKLQLPVLKRYLGEVALSSTLKSLLVQGTPVAYVLTSCSPGIDVTNTAIGGAYGGFFTGLQSLGFEVRQLDLRDGVPRDAALVIVLEPGIEFVDSDAFALFEYVKRGGRLLLDYAWSPVESRNPTGGKLGELLGYELGAGRVLHLIRDVTNRTGGRGLDGDQAVAKLQLLVNRQHAVTKRLAQSGRALEVANARELKLRGGVAGVEATELLATGSAGWIGRVGSDGLADLRSPGAQLLRSFLVGAVLEVSAPPASDGAPPAPDAPKGEVVIVSGVFCNNVGLPQFGDLAFNICNWMAERKVLLNIQSGGYTARQLQLVPQQVNRIAWLLCLGVPLLFLIGGLVVYFVRRRV